MLISKIFVDIKIGHLKYLYLSRLSLKKPSPFNFTESCFYNSRIIKILKGFNNNLISSSSNFYLNFLF